MDPIVIKGYKFFNSRTKENVIIKGIDYYPRPNAGDLDVNGHDFFTEEYRHIWERDIPQFQELGINAIRLYSVDSDQDHSAFMCALNDAGIYVLVELATGSCHDCAITKFEAPHCYHGVLKMRGEAIIKEFSRYTNTLAFSAGNEVNHFVPLGEQPQWNAPCLKKFVKDMRAFMKRCDHMRHVPIGLIMADSDRDENTMYYNCQSDKNDDLEHAEWYGLNTYVYCNGKVNTFENSTGFKTLSESFDSYDYSIPVLLTEYGCLSQTFPTIDGYEGQRNFNQAKWLGLPNVQDNFAGGMAFEYSIEKANAQTPFPFKEFGEQNYGIGYFAPDNCDDISIKCEYKRTPSFYNLKKAYAQVKADSITMDDFTPSESRIGRTECPAQFPKLSSYHWLTDFRMSQFCPSKSQTTWTCPASNTSGTSDTSKTTVVAEQNSMNLGMVVGLIALITLIIINSIIKKKSFIRTQSIEQFESWNVEKDAKSDSTDENDEEDSFESSTLLGSKDEKENMRYDSLVTKLDSY